MKWRSDLLRKSTMLLAALLMLAAVAVPTWAAVQAYTEKDANVFGGTIDGFAVWQDYTDDGVNGVATSSYNYPAAPFDPGVPMGTDTVAGERDMSAYAHVDESAGVLNAYTHSWLSVWGAEVDHISTYAYAGARADISESFVLSDPATIALSGIFEGTLGGDSLIYDNYCCWQPAEASLSISFTYNDGSEDGAYQGIDYDFDSKGSFNEAFSAPIELPAGVEIYFNASLDVESAVSPNISWILEQRGITDPGQLTGVAGETWVDATHTASFVLGVPEGVTLTSTRPGSDLLLPIEVQPVPEPSTLLALASGFACCGLGILRKRKM